MIRFGKKINLRPLLIGLIVAFIPGSFFYAFFGAWMGLFVGLCFFAAIFIYYYINSPKVFNYWQFDGENVEYYDMSNSWKPALMILFPHFVKMDSISKEEIKSIKVLGDMNELKKLPSMVPVSNAYNIFSAQMSMMKNPLAIKITTIDGKVINLDISRDYTYDKDKTTQSVDNFLSDVKIS